MTAIVPLALFGWVAVAVFMFLRTDARTAAVTTVVGGALLLPSYLYDLPGLPPFGKDTAIAVGLVVGGFLSGAHVRHRYSFRAADVPMLAWCVVVPVLTSMSNGLGLRNGLSDVLAKTIQWGIPYWAGRRYFASLKSLRTLSVGLLFGGMLYVPLTLFEVRMSPQLSNMVYGFFAHDWRQHIRYGGYRPIVFMEHGLMVALWIAACATVAFWMWRERTLARVGPVPIAWLWGALLVSAILSRSASGWSFLALGMVLLLVSRKPVGPALLRMIVLSVPIYIALRLSGIITSEAVASVVSAVFDDERISSLLVRLRQEELFGERALQRFLVGWGGYGRGWPVDDMTGERLIRMVDAFWVIAFSTYGIVGLSSWFLALAVGPWRGVALIDYRRHHSHATDTYWTDTMVLSVVVVFFLVDSLLNGMINPVYILISGALVDQPEERQLASPPVGFQAT